MKTLVISLTSSLQRRESARQALDRVGIEFEFLDAVDGRLGQHPLLTRFKPEKFLSNHGRPAVPGEVGCYASHYLAWQRCVESGLPTLVFEDDFVLESHFAEALELATRLAGGIPFIRMERTSPKAHYTVYREGRYRLIKFLKVPQCLTCYVIRPEAAEAFIAASREFVYPVDVFVRHQHLHRVPIYGLTPHSVRPSGTDSEIGDRHLAKVPRRTKAIRAVRRVGWTLRNARTNLHHLLEARAARRRALKAGTPGP